MENDAKSRYIKHGIEMLTEYHTGQVVYPGRERFQIFMEWFYVEYKGIDLETLVGAPELTELREKLLYAYGQLNKKGNIDSIDMLHFVYDKYQSDKYRREVLRKQVNLQ